MTKIRMIVQNNMIQIPPGTKFQTLNDSLELLVKRAKALAWIQASPRANQAAMMMRKKQRNARSVEVMRRMHLHDSNAGRI